MTTTVRWQGPVAAAKAGQWQPFHVVNIALNVVNSKRLAWQERKAEPFTATPLHCGTAAERSRLSADRRIWRQ